MKKCIFAGTFDPFTVGHADTVKKSLALFDEVVIAVAVNHEKKCMFSPAERAEMIKSVFEGESRVRVLIWEGIIADLLTLEKTPFYVRGIRNARDYEYETEAFYASRDFSMEMIPVYLPAEREVSYVSSTLVRNCIAFEKPYARYVPAAVLSYIRGQHVRKTN